MNLARFLGEPLADVLAMHQNVIDDARDIHLRALFRLPAAAWRRYRRLRRGLFPDLGSRQFFHMRAAAHGTIEQTAALLRREIVAGGKPTFEAMLIPADEVENDHDLIPDPIVAYIRAKLGN